MSLNRSVVFELFEEMRHSTPEEQKLYRRMLNKYNVPREEGMNIMDLEMGTCDICGAEDVLLVRRYYYYDIKCDCCGTSKGHHFEIVRHCKDCTPRPPRIIKVRMKPIDE